MSSRYYFRLFIIFLCLSAASVSQALELASILQDHMVLQRGKTLTLNGWAKPGSQVEVNFNDLNYTAMVTSNGQWAIKVKPHKAGGPFKFSFSSSEKTIELNDVYFGDVWLASGQSNMEWKLGWHVNNWQHEIKDSHYPLIRYFDVPNRFKASPQTHLENASWVLSSPETVAEYSAIAWFFAKHALFEKNVAIGVIDATVGGTAAEPWTPIETLASMESTRKASQKFSDTSIDWDKEFEHDQYLMDEKSRLAYGTDGFRLQNLASPKLDDSNWNTLHFPNKEALNDIVWMRKEIKLDLKALGEMKDVQLRLGPVPQTTRFYVNNKLAAEKVGYERPYTFALDPKLFKNGSNTLAIRMLNTWNNRNRISKKDQFWISFDDKKISLEGLWKWNNRIEAPIEQPKNYWKSPTTLYNGMVHPIVGYGLKGVIWYQGESNSKRAQFYREIFGNMITSWRERWQQPNMPFLFVQLAGFRAIPNVPKESKWAELREAQAQTLELKNTGMAVAMDVGSTSDIHPRDKQSVAKRLWLLAKSVAYGEKVLASGPTAKSIKTKKNKLIISYKHIGKGLQVEGPIHGFALAGEDGKYYNAQALIKGKKVVVTSSQVTKPISVRYAWADNSKANLYNSAGLPAVPFRMGESQKNKK